MSQHVQDTVGIERANQFSIKIIMCYRTFIDLMYKTRGA
jgi:hypothetical protein